MPPKHQRYRCLLSASKVSGITPRPNDVVDVQAGPAGAQQAQGELGVLGDAPLVPAAEPRSAPAPDQAHGAGEDRAVALVARGLGDGEEVLVGVVEPPEVGGDSQSR